MATLVLSTVGTLVGGPVGGLVGAALGRRVDGAIIGGSNREGPRLKELAFSTSSYGTPIARVFGTMRVAGSVVWATDLAEHSAHEGGGKGQPGTTSYSYTASFAVAVSSRPIAGIGRIWADGNLLRGAAGDLKTGGTLRIHRGVGDQPPDPLIAAALGPHCPAFRGLAYAMFEDLPLADFGNRLPALTFEVMAGDDTLDLAELVPEMVGGDAEAALPGLTGLTQDGGIDRDLLETVVRLYPVALAGFARQPTLVAGRIGTPATLPEPLAAPHSADGASVDDVQASRAPPPAAPLAALRYYDPALDFQPGLQRSEGHAADPAGATLDFPAALPAGEAKRLLRAAERRERASRQRLTWRIAALDTRFAPGSVVRAPGHAGLWRIASWEWREDAVALELLRETNADPAIAPARTDAGTPVRPRDVAPGVLTLRLLDLPWDGTGLAQPPLYAALAGENPGEEAALFVEHGSELVPLALSMRAAAVTGHLAEAVPPSPAMRFEPSASVTITLDFASGQFAPTTMAGLAAGSNRLLVDGEVLQFLDAEPVDDRTWYLRGLLRGRAGTELQASCGHGAGVAATLLDATLIALPAGSVPNRAGARIAAIGRAAAAPVYAVLENAGAGSRPLAPVHPSRRRGADGALTYGWTRRARGAWLWRDGVEVPLAEESERYRIGIGDPDMPSHSWTTPGPCLTLDAATATDLAARFAGAPLWVRQVGSVAVGPPLQLDRI